MSLLLFFVLVFCAGPFLFRGLTRAAPTMRGSHALVVLAVVCAGLALGLRYGMQNRGAAGTAGGSAWAAFALIWLGWIAVLAFVTQTVRRADPRRGMRRWTAVCGTIGTTVPWFGLAWASQFAP